MATINTIPSFGDKTEDVKTLQKTLNNIHGSNLEIDGIFGNITKKAVMKFQERNGLAVDGIVGKNTMRVLGLEFGKCIDNEGNVRLSWDRIAPIKVGWTNLTIDCISSLYDSSFSKCLDIIDFRDDYYSLSRKEKIVIWAELISAISKFESGWKPTSWMVEKTMGEDPVTKKQVRSEGLLQLSYQDKRSYSSIECEFDWEHDKSLDENDAHKTIFNPRINLQFGIKILAKQIDRASKIALSSGVYWAVLKNNGKYSKLSEIKTMVNSLKF